MKLAKKTRERLYKADGKPLEITWPESAPEPHAGRRYPIYSEKGEKVFTVLLERSKRATGLKTGTKAVVKIDNDPHRPLIGLAGTRNELGDYEPEPERVSEEFEARLAMAGGAKTARHSAERTLETKRQGKEQRAGSVSRSERAVMRHQKATERQLAA